MRLASKIFLASAGSLLVLSAVTIFLVAHRTAAREEERAAHDLGRAQEDIRRELARGARETGLLLEPEIPRMRGFAADPRDNFVQIARDLRRTTGAHAILVTDAQGRVLGLDAVTDTADLDPAQIRELPRAIDRAERIEYVERLRGRLYHASIFPVKELESNDFASLAITALTAMDAAWVARIPLDEPDDGVILLAGTEVVHATLPADRAAAVLNAARDHRQIARDPLGERWVYRILAFPAPPPGVELVLARSLDRALAPMRTLQRAIGLASLSMLVAAVAVAGFAARLIARPVGVLVKATRRVGKGEIDFELPEISRDEIGELGHQFNLMLHGLRDRERTKATFGKYVAPAVVEMLLTNPAALALGGERRELTVYFSDIKGFTTLSEAMGPEEVVRFLNTYLTAMTIPIVGTGGIVDKYIGDAVVAFWTRPFHVGNHAAAACRSALTNIRALKVLREQFDRADLRALEIRIGLSSGEAVVGNIGSELIRGYTAIGDVVNLGARLEGANKSYGTHILLSEPTRAQAGNTIIACELDLIRLVGKTQPVRVYELVCMQGEADEATLAAIARYEKALKLYRERSFAEAIAALEPDAAMGRAAALTARCRKFVETPPPPEWDGVYESTSK